MHRKAQLHSGTGGSGLIRWPHIHPPASASRPFLSSWPQAGLLSPSTAPPSLHPGDAWPCGAISPCHSRVMGAAPGLGWEGAGGTCKHPTRHKTISHNKGLLGPQMSPIWRLRSLSSEQLRPQPAMSPLGHQLWREEARQGRPAQHGATGAPSHRLLTWAPTNPQSYWAPNAEVPKLNERDADQAPWVRQGVSKLTEWQDARRGDTEALGVPAPESGLQGPGFSRPGG